MPAKAEEVPTFAEIADSYRYDPLGFALDCFEPGSIDLDTWQRQFLEDLGAEVRRRGFDPDNPRSVEPIRMAVASGHGIGKSTLAALVFWWIMCTRPDAKVRVTANTFKQLSVITWKAITVWGQKCSFAHWFEITESAIYQKDNRASWFADPQTCGKENHQAFAGLHNLTSTTAFIFDEASDIEDVIWETADNGLTDGEGMWFAFGNPMHNTGKFHEACFGGWRHRWNARSINSMECKFPNHDKHQQDIEDHGWDSDYVKTRIRGLPPAQSEDQLIGRDVVGAAQQRQVVVFEDEPLIAGVDVPDGGSAWFIVRFRRGHDARPGPYVPDPIRVAGSQIDRDGMVNKLAWALGQNDVAAMFIDSAFGAAIVERLKAYGFRNVFEISFGGKSPDPRYGNMRAYMWAGQMAEWLKKGCIDTNDKKLAEDLCSPGFHRRVGGDGALLLESKDEMKKRGVRSPDDGDALALTFASPVAAPRKDEHGGDGEWRAPEGYDVFANI